MPRFIPIFSHFLVELSLIFTPSFDSLNLQNHCFPTEKQHFFNKIVLRNWHRCLLDFGANMLPLILQNTTKILPKIYPKRHRFFDRFLHRCLSILVRFWKPTWSHVGHFFAQNTATLTNGWVFYVGSVFFSVFWASWPPLGALWARFGRVRASILEVFGAHFLHNFQVFCTHFFSNHSPMLKHLLH